jgi:hypothetical protein
MFQPYDLFVTTKFYHPAVSIMKAFFNRVAYLIAFTSYKPPKAPLTFADQRQRFIRDLGIGSWFLVGVFVLFFLAEAMNPVIDRYLTEKYCKPYDGPELCLQVKKLAVKPWTEKLLNVPHVVESYMKGISEYLKKKQPERNHENH